MKITAGEIARAVGGTVVLGDPGIYVTGIATDSNKTVKGDLFVPVIGRRVDGHRFIGGAVRNGAAAAFTSEDLPEELLRELRSAGAGRPAAAAFASVVPEGLLRDPVSAGAGKAASAADAGGIEISDTGTEGTGTTGAEAADMDIADAGHADTGTEGTGTTGAEAADIGTADAGHADTGTTGDEAADTEAANTDIAGVEAAGAGAAGVDGRDGIPAVIRVRDTIAALQDFAGYYRDKYVRIPYIGVTGSVGKTTTREMTACALSAALDCYSTKGNANSQTGVPITVAATPEDAQVGVIEMGISEFGEMERLSRVVRCDAAIVTVIDISHIAQLKSRENIMREKLHIAEDMPEGGVLIVNADDDLLGSLTLDKLHGLGIACGKRLEIRGFGTSGSAYYRAGNIRETADGGMRFTVTMPGRKDVPNSGKDDASIPGRKDVPNSGKDDASIPGKKDVPISEKDDVSIPGRKDVSTSGKAGASISGKVDAFMPGEADADMTRCIEVTLSVPGRHMVMNAISALAAADVLGVDSEAAARKLAGFKNLEGRGREVTAGGIRIINDAYNASPLSMKAGLRVLGRTPTGSGGRRIAVLADMKELGGDEVRYHREVGEFIARETNIDMVLAYGELAAELIAGVKEAWPEAGDTGSAAGRIGTEIGGTDAECGMTTDGAAGKTSGGVRQCGCGIYFHKYEELYEYLCGAVRSGDVLLFKASNSMKLWRMAGELALDLNECDRT